MAIRVTDLLKLPELRSAKIIAGKNGLHKPVYRISVCDVHPDDSIISDGIAQQGDFYLSSIFLNETDISAAIHTIKLFIKIGISGLLLVNKLHQRIYDLPKEITDLCNELDFPIIVGDCSLAYPSIIKNGMEMIFKELQLCLMASKIEDLASGKLGVSQTMNIVKDIYPGHKEKLTAIYAPLSCPYMDLIDDQLEAINDDPSTKAFHYSNGILIIYSYDSTASSTKKVQWLSDILKSRFDSDVVGISTDLEISAFGQAVNEALLVSKAALFDLKSPIYYASLSVEIFLLLQKDPAIINGYYMRYVKPIEEHDQKYRSNLLDTMVCYIKNDGDAKKTAAELFQHENTTRYKISTVKALMNLEEAHFQFYQHLLLSVRTYQLMKKS
ncbi:MAG: hypothetical protein HFE75_00905 [Firmicutes bacterium]|jgi:hypothetical protein|nr:hypothetical protein [Bacillota bacterium]